MISSAVYSAAATLSVANIVAYLQHLGWSRVTNRARYSVWLSPGGDHDVVVPADSRVGDYALRVSELVQTVAAACNEPALTVVRNIAAVGTDIIRLRMQHPRSRSGTLPLDEGVAFVQKTRDLVLAAACAAAEAREVFYSRKPAKAVDYMKRARLGQTEHGSFIVTVESPIPLDTDPVGTLRLPGLEPPPAPAYERKVTETLLAAVGAAIEAAREADDHGSFLPFREAVHAGVSANLCSAIADLCDLTEASSIDVRVSWSSTHAVSQSLPEQLTIKPAIATVLRDAAARFTVARPEPNVRLQGFVVKLDRDTSQVNGRVTLRCQMADGTPRSIRVTLWGDDYKKCVAAHDSKNLVSLRGELDRSGRHWELRGPRDIEVLRDPDDPDAPG